MAAFPNFPCDRMIAAAELEFKNAGFRLEGDRNGKVVFAWLGGGFCYISSNCVFE